MSQASLRLRHKTLKLVPEANKSHPTSNFSSLIKSHDAVLQRQVIECYSRALKQKVGTLHSDLIFMWVLDVGKLDTDIRLRTYEISLEAMKSKIQGSNSNPNFSSLIKSYAP